MESNKPNQTSKTKWQLQIVLVKSKKRSGCLIS